MRIDYLKNQNSIVIKERDEFEHIFKAERLLKEEYLSKLDLAEKRMLDAQHETESHRRKSDRYEEEINKLRRDIYKMEGDREGKGDRRTLEIARL